MKHYTYLITNPITNQPFYVGKGRGSRYNAHFRKAVLNSRDTNPDKIAIMQSIVAANLEPLYTITEFSTEEEALAHELQLIKLFGTRNEGGLLTNKHTYNFKGSSSKRAVKQYNIYQEYIRSFDSMTDAVESLGKTHRDVHMLTKCCQKKDYFKTGFGYVWCYADTEPDWDWIYETSKPVYAFTDTGLLVERFPTPMAAAKWLGAAWHHRYITKGGYYKGYVWA